MREFEFEGRTYRFDAQCCYDRGALVALPDGRLLEVAAWLEVIPPIPEGFKVRPLPPVEFADEVHESFDC